MRYPRCSITFLANNSMDCLTFRSSMPPKAKLPPKTLCRHFLAPESWRGIAPQYQLLLAYRRDNHRSWADRSDPATNPPDARGPRCPGRRSGAIARYPTPNSGDTECSREPALRFRPPAGTGRWYRRHWHIMARFLGHFGETAAQVQSFIGVLHISDYSGIPGGHLELQGLLGTGGCDEYGRVRLLHGRRNEVGSVQLDVFALAGKSRCGP